MSTIAITGAGGTVGSALTRRLTAAGHRVVRLVRHAPGHPDQRHWDPTAPAHGLLDGADAVVHLAGAGIFGRFTAAHERAIRASRVGPTYRLAREAARSSVPVFISASAIGIYGADRGDQVLTEQTALPRLPDFLGGVVRDWEAAAVRGAGPNTRVVCVRTGLVQDGASGMLRLMAPLFRAGLGGPIGGGRQWQSWIALDDLVSIYEHALRDEDLRGPVNAVAPNPVRNADYTSALAAAVGRPAPWPIPALAPAVLFGLEGARELASANQRVVPAVLTERGFTFRYPELDAALAHTLR